MDNDIKRIDIEMDNIRDWLKRLEAHLRIEAKRINDLEAKNG